MKSKIFLLLVAIIAGTMLLNVQPLRAQAGNTGDALVHRLHQVGEPSGGVGDETHGATQVGTSQWCASCHAGPRGWLAARPAGTELPRQCASRRHRAG